ncbi:DUF368 domain-containing protein [Microbacterium amylolyticum]|uniref:Membrane protein n=1 Tax=Microbacterium amylolyticum TaxID=936337 RepID=A0ABS4ZJ66_9MICO|nr:DUF368 domain-containing protein [Microbacterium amylolyticum]MBP2437332.1 putative membrane protein [Microbacterium amylolyticum]
MTNDTAQAPAPRRGSLAQAPLNVVRGGLIGLAETVPGISGGTVALVVGVYERALDAAGDLGGGFAALVKGPDHWRGFTRRMAAVDWWLIGPLLVGMVVTVLAAAGVVVGFVDGHPENSRGLFFGLVAASLIVPFQIMPKGVGRGRIAIDIATVVVAAVIAFVLVGFAGGTAIASPPFWAVFLAAAVAVCALVVPGISGSFFLLAIGLYSPTLTAVDERDLGYIAVFAAGAIVGLLTIVKIIRTLLRTRRRATLLVMAGLMLGSLRALWPWQGGEHSADGAGSLLAPTEPLVPIILAVVGAGVVIALIIAERVLQKRAS